MFCPSGQGLMHTSHRVKQGIDDVEEFQDTLDDSHGNCNTGFLYQGSSDLELGNDIDQGKCGQLVGIRFQDVNVPAGATIMQASIKFTVDESYNPTIVDGAVYAPGESSHGDTYWGNWTAPVTAIIKGRKVPHAVEWLDPASTDPAVIANRDCPKNSQCLNNYDCHVLAPWWQSISGQTMTDCSALTDGTFSSHPTIVGYIGAGAPPCDCTGCDCVESPKPKVLSTIWDTGSTSASIGWSPEGESIHPTQLSERRPTQMTPDLSTIVQEIIQLDGWAAGNAMAFVIDGHPNTDGSGALRTYESYDGANTATHTWTTVEPPFGPTLEIAYCAPITCPAGYTPAFETIRVHDGLDDVEESQTGDGAGFLYQARILPPISPC